MELDRPTITDPKVLEYVENLEKQLFNFTTNKTFISMYIALRKQSESISKVYSNLEINETILSDKEDKLTDRFFNWVKMAPSMTEALSELEQKINPKVQEKVDKYLKGGGSGISIEEMVYGGRS